MSEEDIKSREFVEGLRKLQGEYKYWKSKLDGTLDLRDKTIAEDGLRRVRNVKIPLLVMGTFNHMPVGGYAQ